MTTNLSSLIERIEKSEGADRSIDVLIGAVVRWLPPDGQAWLRDWRGDFGPMPRMTGRIAAFHDNGDAAVHWEAPNFTASLDAAMTLVPDLAHWSVGFDKHGNRALIGSSGSMRVHTGKAATPALALCAASLRARASEGER